MTLKEKFAEFTKQESWEKENNNAKECEQIADDYAVEFAEWLGVNNYKKYSNGWANMFTKASSEKQLLEIFKKEKGL